MGLEQAFVLVVMVLSYDGNLVTSTKFETEDACRTAQEWSVEAVKDSPRIWVKAECFGESVPVTVNSND